MQSDLSPDCIPQSNAISDTEPPAIAAGALREDSERQLREANDVLEQRIAERTRELRALVIGMAQVEQRERQRVAQILHDNLQQVLVAATMHCHLAASQVASGPGSKAIARVQELLTDAIQSSRTMVMELSPPLVHWESLTRALAWIARQKRDRYGLEVLVEGDGDIEPADPDLRELLLRAVREALFNVVKHAGVRTARVTVARDHRDLRVTIADDGRGCESFERQGAPGFGLPSLRERFQHLGGRMELDSAPGRGTRVHLLVPAASSEPESMEQAHDGH